MMTTLPHVKAKAYSVHEPVGVPQEEIHATDTIAYRPVQDELVCVRRRSVWTIDPDTLETIDPGYTTWHLVAIPMEQVPFDDPALGTELVEIYRAEAGEPAIQVYAIGVDPVN